MLRQNTKLQFLFILPRNFLFVVCWHIAIVFLITSTLIILCSIAGEFYKNNYPRKRIKYGEKSGLCQVVLLNVKVFKGLCQHQALHRNHSSSSTLVRANSESSGKTVRMHTLLGVIASLI